MYTAAAAAAAANNNRERKRLLDATAAASDGLLVCLFFFSCVWRGQLNGLRNCRAARGLIGHLPATGGVTVSLGVARVRAGAAMRLF